MGGRGSKTVKIKSRAAPHLHSVSRSHLALGTNLPILRGFLKILCFFFLHFGGKDAIVSFCKATVVIIMLS